MAFSPQLNPDRIGEIALEYSRWMLQVGVSPDDIRGKRARPQAKRLERKHVLL